MERADRYYVHHVYTVQPRPPFAIQTVGPPFRFPHHFGGTDRDAVQFCAGLALADDGRELLISYGVADCVSLLVSKPVTDVFGVNLSSPVRRRKLKRN